MLTSPSISLESPRNVLRFGLIDIKPVEIKETIRKFGEKFVRRAWKLETLAINIIRLFLRVAMSMADYDESGRERYERVVAFGFAEVSVKRSCT